MGISLSKKTAGKVQQLIARMNDGPGNTAGGSGGQIVNSDLAYVSCGAITTPTASMLYAGTVQLFNASTLAWQNQTSTCLLTGAMAQPLSSGLRYLALRTGERSGVPVFVASCGACESDEVTICGHVVVKSLVVTLAAIFCSHNPGTTIPIEWDDALQQWIGNKTTGANTIHAKLRCNAGTTFQLSLACNAGADSWQGPDCGFSNPPFSWCRAGVATIAE